MRTSVGKKLYISVLAVFLVFTVAFMFFQQRRERQYRIDALNIRLQDYNARMHEALCYTGRHDEASLTRYVASHHQQGLRVTLIDARGRVFFDNVRKDYAHFGSHANRKEVVDALRAGSGSDIERNSTTLGHDYFYSATWFPREGYIIRSALPYNDNLARTLRGDQHYLWFALTAILILTLVLWRFMHRLGTNVTKLKLFATRADHGESLDTKELLNFPDDELGEIAERIIKLYRQLQTTREEQDKLKRQLTQNVAHELKTPVASIQGYLETILHNPRITPAQKQTFLERSFAQSQRLTALLQDISTLNRLDDAPELMQIGPVDLVKIITQIEDETALQLEDHQMAFVTHLPPTIKVRGNQSLLYSIFRNLTDNAIAYAGTGTTITLTANEQEDHWQFCFSDNGVGVPSEHLQRLFERFYRVDKGRSRKMGGTGLGLAIVKNAIMLHGGSISVKNNPEGGLRFDFTLQKDNT